MDTFTVDVIGYVRSEVEEAVDHGWGGVESVIELEPEYAAGLLGLEEFTHALVITYMHQADFDRSAHIRRRPQGRASMPCLGIFAQRAKHRPNPLGVTAVEILSVGESTLEVRGLDMIDGTPVLDIKPYVRQYDCKGESEQPDWIDILLRDYFG